MLRAATITMALLVVASSCGGVWCARLQQPGASLHDARFEAPVAKESCNEMARADARLDTQNVVGDNAYDSDQLDSELDRYDSQLISPHRINRSHRTTVLATVPHF